MSKERVAIVKVTERRIDEALEQMLELLGGLDDIVPSASRVLVKPNFVSAHRPWYYPSRADRGRRALGGRDVP